MERIHVEPEVSAALRRRAPVVALETSFLAHGLPVPENLRTARAMLAAVRQTGAVPAMIGIISGELRIGLDATALEYFAGEPGIPKASERDLGVLIGLRRDGATTVAATIACAARVGIRVMATGGIGGVHRGGETSLDISADLRALGRHPVAVVCSGAKSILDLELTMEVLETEGVSVVGYGTDRLPGFHIARTHIPLEHSVSTPEQAAQVLAAHFDLDGRGLVLANPVPIEAAIETRKVESWVAEAERGSRSDGVRGKAQTPDLLSRIARLSNGETLAANRALLESNARLGGEIAVQLSLLSGRG